MIGRGLHFELGLQKFNSEGKCVEAKFTLKGDPQKILEVTEHLRKCTLNISKDKNNV